MSKVDIGSILDRSNCEHEWSGWIGTFDEPIICSKCSMIAIVCDKCSEERGETVHHQHKNIDAFLDFYKEHNG